MRMGFDLTLEQAQKLIMTPELRQAIQLLQFTSQELNQYIEQQIQVNPLLEIGSSAESEVNIDDFKEKFEEIDWKEYLGQYDDISYSYSNYSEKNEIVFDNFITSQTSLKEQLLFQLNMTIYDKELKSIGEIIIESIDKNGYLNTTVEEIANQLSVDVERVEEVLKVIQNFDPVGVGARNLKECLLVQLKYKGIDNENVYKVVDHYLEDLAQNRLHKISKELDTTLKEVQWISDLIKSLEPKPGRGFVHDSDDIRFVTPDIIVHYIDNEYIILLNDSAGPRLNINSFYKQLLKSTNDDKIREFLTDKLNSAMWIIKSIEQRKNTIYKVAQSILKFQKDFFDKGEKALKPLTLKDIANDIGVHESTVSRATNGKYMQTPRGIFELKYFFSSSISNRNGSISSTSVKSMIKDLIDNENPKKPLSDQQISDILKKKNIKISRRTVAKYRDELGIPSSSMRRRF